MTRQDDDHRVACTTLTYLAEPADPALGILLQALSPARHRSSPRSGQAPSRPARPWPWTKPRQPGSGPHWPAGGERRSPMALGGT
jgi:hypothetical protein